MSVVVIALGISACKTPQESAHEKPECKMRFKNKAGYEDFFAEQALQYKWLKLKADITYSTANSEQSFTVSFRIRKDSLIYISITKVGIPVAKILMDSSTIQIQNLIEDTYQLHPYSYIDSISGLSLPFSVWPKVLLGEPVFLSDKRGHIWIKEGLVNLANAKLKQIEQEKNAVVKSEELIEWHRFDCDDLSLKLFSLMDFMTQKELWVSYQNKEDINGFVLNKNIEVRGLENDKDAFLAKMEIYRVKAYDDLKIPFEKPSDAQVDK